MNGIQNTLYVLARSASRRRSPAAVLHRRLSYIPLDSDQNEISLLSLLPEDGASSIPCSLEHVSLINPPQYVALSCCWGDFTATKEIKINGEAVNVTSNLESALRHLRVKGYSRLWIDAICINQKDKAEKSQQLLWMGSIYRRAKEVAAWTGDESTDFRKALGFIKSPWEILYAEDNSRVAKDFDFPMSSTLLDLKPQVEKERFRGSSSDRIGDECG